MMPGPRDIALLMAFSVGVGTGMLFAGSTSYYLIGAFIGIPLVLFFAALCFLLKR